MISGDTAKLTECDAVVPGGQGSPEVRTGTLTLLNVSIGGVVREALDQVPRIMPGPLGAATMVHLTPDTTVVITTPPCGMVSEAAEPSGSNCTQCCHAPLVVTVAGVPTLVLQFVNTGAAIGAQTGPERFWLSGSAGTVAVVVVSAQFTDTPPSEKLASVDVASNRVAAGETVVEDWANAGWAPSQITAASDAATR